jgi:type III secretion protein N (ATPase)
VDKEHKEAAQRLRQLMAKYDDVELLLKIGEYKKGSDPLADEAIEKMPAIRAFLQQGLDEATGFDETIARLKAI